MCCFLHSVCRLPRYACQFIEMCLMVTADHGPAVSGAHNTIVCARAGKDLISSLTSGLLTIVRSCSRWCIYCKKSKVNTHLFNPSLSLQGDRFGGALDAAAKQFSKAFDSGMLPMEFVNKMKKDGMLIMGIGHRVKSVSVTAPKNVHILCGRQQNYILTLGISHEFSINHEALRPEPSKAWELERNSNLSVI